MTDRVDDILTILKDNNQELFELFKEYVEDNEVTLVYGTCGSCTNKSNQRLTECVNSNSSSDCLERVCDDCLYNCYLCSNKGCYECIHTCIECNQYICEDYDCYGDSEGTPGCCEKFICIKCYKG